MASQPFAGPPVQDLPVRVMIVDDSAVARAVFRRMVGAHPSFDIVAECAGAPEALEALGTVRPDIILLDIEMPGGNGIDALPELLVKSGGARILVVSALAEEGAAETVRALTLGAADTLAKPGRYVFSGGFGKQLTERLMRLARDDHGWAPQIDPVDLAVSPDAPSRSQWLAMPIACVGIGASTGGLHAISEFFRALPPEFDAPILITQHLPEIFMPFFAQQLREMTGRNAQIACAGEWLARGRLYVAPGRAHLCVEKFGDRARIRLDTGISPTRCMPSVDPMFATMASAFGAHAVGIVLTGMGRDGSVGAQTLATAGAEILAQSSETSVVWGMPGSVARAGLAAGVFAPDEIARHLGARNPAR